MYTTGEKIELKRAVSVQVSANEVLAGYTHAGSKHASIVSLRFDDGEAVAKGSKNKWKKDQIFISFISFHFISFFFLLKGDKLKKLAEKLAVQVTGFKPSYLQANQAPEDIAKGNDRTPFLLESPFVRFLFRFFFFFSFLFFSLIIRMQWKVMADPSGEKSVAEVLESEAKKIGTKSLQVSSFVRWSLGEEPVVSRIQE